MRFIYEVFFILFGLVIFSFLNVVIYRVPNHISFVKGRSFCPSCGNQLKGYDMIPVLSWLILGGKCRSCKSRISPRYPFVELLGGVFAWLSLNSFGEWNGYWNAVTIQAVLVFSVMAILTVVAFVDYDTMEIPNGFVIALMIPALISIFTFPETSLISKGIGMLCVSVPMLILALIIPGAFGGGDIKLMAAAGFFLGWKLTLAAFLIAILTGGFYGIWLLIAKKKGKKDHFAFGPFLCVGIAIAVYWGEPLINWYLNLIL